MADKTQEQEVLENKARKTEQRLADIHVELKRLREAFLAGAITAEELKADRAERDTEAEKCQEELNVTKRRLEELSVDEDRTKAELVIQRLKEISLKWQDYTHVVVEQLLFGQEVWRDKSLAPEGGFRSVDLPADHPNKELRDRLLEVVQNLVKRVTADNEGTIREYTLQIQPAQAPIKMWSEKVEPSPPQMSQAVWDAHLAMYEQHNPNADHIANRKCITSPSLTS